MIRGKLETLLFRKHGHQYTETLSISSQILNCLRCSEELTVSLQLQNNLFKCIPSFPQLPCLNSYDSYCSNQVAAKALLDHKKQDHRVQDFLQRCLESPFSRKLDLWNFLDIPRSRLVKYPLLLREILRHTPNDHPDQQHLEEAVSYWIFFLSYLFSFKKIYSTLFVKLE